MNDMDRLRFDYINNLPQPFLVQFMGAKDWWPVIDFEVQCALVRFDVCGKSEVKPFIQIKEIRDGDGQRHNPDTFWMDYEEPRG